MTGEQTNAFLAVLLPHFVKRTMIAVGRPSEYECRCGETLTGYNGESPEMLQAIHHLMVMTPLIEAITNEQMVREQAISDAAGALEDFREFGGPYGQRRKRLHNAVHIAAWLRLNATRIARRQDPQ